MVREQMEATRMEPYAIRVKDFSESIGVSRSKGYEIAAANPELVAKIDGSIRIIVSRIPAWLEKQSRVAAPIDAA